MSRLLVRRARLPVGGPWMPSLAQILETAGGLRDDVAEMETARARLWAEVEGIAKEIGWERVWESVDKSFFDDPLVSPERGYDFQAREVHSKTLSYLAMAILGMAQEFGSDASYVDSFFLTWTYYDYAEDVLRMGWKLSDLSSEPICVRSDDKRTPQELSLLKASALDSALERREASAVEFIREWAQMAVGYPLSPFETFRAVTAPFDCVPCWYPADKRQLGSRGPGRGLTERVRVWGHYLCSFVLGGTVESLKFWHVCAQENPRAAELTYSQPKQDPCSDRAQSSYGMAKKRLFDDLEEIGVVPRDPPTVRRSG